MVTLHNLIGAGDVPEAANLVICVAVAGGRIVIAVSVGERELARFAVPVACGESDAPIDHALYKEVAS